MDKLRAENTNLIGQTGPLNGQKWILTDSLTIGRDESCDIVIPDRQVSRYHARIFSQDDEFILEDLQSKNGTFCNGEQVTESTFLNDGDVIQVALAQHFVFLNSDATLPAEMSAPLKSAPSRKGLVLEKKSRRVWINQSEVLPPLSVPQYRLLEILSDQEGKVVSRQDLITYIWEDEAAVGISEQALDALVRRLRDRLQPYDPQHTYIITIRGHGLRLDNGY